MVFNSGHDDIGHDVDVDGNEIEAELRRPLFPAEFRDDVNPSAAFVGCV